MLRTALRVFKPAMPGCTRSFSRMNRNFINQTKGKKFKVDLPKGGKAQTSKPTKKPDISKRPNPPFDTEHGKNHWHPHFYE